MTETHKPSQPLNVWLSAELNKPCDIARCRVLLNTICAREIKEGHFGLDQILRRRHDEFLHAGVLLDEDKKAFRTALRKLREESMSSGSPASLPPRVLERREHRGSQR